MKRNERRRSLARLDKLVRDATRHDVTRRDAVQCNFARYRDYAERFVDWIVVVVAVFIAACD